jgi:hypothetical protein
VAAPSQWDGRGGVEAIKAVTNQIRKGKDIAKRAGQTPADKESMRTEFISLARALTEITSLTVSWDVYSKLAFAKLYDRQTPMTAADLLNDRVLPFFDELPGKR